MIFREHVIRLHITISLLFVVLTVPVMATFVIVSYRANLQLSADYSEKFIEKSLADTVSVTTQLFSPMLTTVRTAAALMRDQPDYFRQESSAEYLNEILALNEAVYAAYVSFEDGSFRQVRRAISGSAVLGVAPPQQTTVVSRFIDARAKGAATDRYIFLAGWGEPVGSHAGPASYDPRVRGFYRDSVRLKAANISDPYLFASSGELGITVSAPVIARDRVLGVVAGDFTLKTLSRHLLDNRVSPNSTTIISDVAGGIVAHPDFSQALARQDGELVRARLDRLPDPRVRAALAERLRSGAERFKFRAGPDNVEYLGIFSPFPTSFNKEWEMLIIAPTDDFIGQIRRTNRNLLIFGLAALLLQILLIRRLARSVARPIEKLADEVTHIREFRFDKVGTVNSQVHEIRCMAEAVTLLGRSLESFTSYVPRGLVQQLVKSGRSTALGVQSRYLTILFTDIEGFSSLAEAEPSQQLLARVSEYFSVMTQAIEKEHGTVDKFIGDAVMAFWGAPATLDDHAYRACVAAVRAQRAMAARNSAWIAQNIAPLRVRIGIHADSALVGNVGSVERVSYSVMGDGVNVAARLEGINKEMGTWTCVSHAVYREAGERLWLRPIDSVTVKGRKGELVVYELLGIRDIPELAANAEEIALCELTSLAYAQYAQGKLAAAANAYQAILERFPEDPVARRMRDKCRAQGPRTAQALAAPADAI
ncbi:MAG TPA: adenylate/guanylate cyclase domain-containing protein [Noviherbaspirillum sp.]|nr:adenylate/guanylate cyclase domain-containing protein [Noviherbaspirillum sp.]